MLPDIPTDDLDDATLARRLKFRAWHRGTREADFLIGSFVDKELAAADRARLEELARLLEEPDADLMDWAAGRAEPPGRWQGAMVERLRAHVPTMARELFNR